MKPFTPALTERAVQREILRMCGSVFPAALVTHVANGAHLAGDERARAIQMRKLRNAGLVPGFPDLIVLWAGGGVGFLEVKRPEGGWVRPRQRAMHQQLRELGQHIAVVTSAVEAQAMLLGWGVPASAVRWRAP